MNALTKSTPLALINLKDCKEFMDQISAEGAGCAKRIKLAGSIEDPYFCGHDIGIVLGYVDVKKFFKNLLTTMKKNRSKN